MVFAISFSFCSISNFSLPVVCGCATSALNFLDESIERVAAKNDFLWSNLLDCIVIVTA